MSTESNFTYTNADVQSDRESYTIYLDLPQKIMCGEPTPPGWKDECDTGWNCNLCAGDKEYQQPVIIGDTIHMQFRVRDLVNGDTLEHGWNDGTTGDWYIDLDLVDKDCEIIEGDFGDIATNWAVGRLGGNRFVRGGSGGFTYQNIKIIVSEELYEIGDCFRFKITYKDTPTTTAFFYSEPFEVIDPACEETFRIRADYARFDCERQYYGIADPDREDQFVGNQNLAFVNQKRYRGVLEHIRTTYERETNDNEVVTKVTTKDEYLLSIYPVPVYEKSQLTALFGGVEVLIFLLEAGSAILFRFNEISDISKNNTVGRMWHIQATLKKPCGSGNGETGDCD